MKRFGRVVLIGLLLLGLFAGPWMFRAAYAVGSCAVFRSWNTGDSVTAGDLNSSFTTAAVTNSTPQCLDDYSATVAQMQANTDPFASGTESQATSAAGEIERLRFMFKQIFGLTQWYRHDQAPTFAASHMFISALHLGSTGVAGGTDTTQNQFLSRFPVLTGPNHWTGIWWPHNTTHMAISIADYNHAQGGVQGGIELFRFHARGLIFHHTVALMFKHSESQMHNGQRGHVTALSIDPTTDQLVFGHPGATMRLAGTGITGQGGTHKALFLSTAGHVYANAAIVRGGPASVQIFTSSGTWTKPAGIRRVVVEVVGSGGGGGGNGATNANQSAAGGGGGGGGYTKSVLDVRTIASATITVGASAAGGVGANSGAAGNPSSWADGTTTLTGNGGTGGSSGNTAAPPSRQGGGGAGGTGTGGLINATGGGGTTALCLADAVNSCSAGGGGGTQLGGSAAGRTGTGAGSTGSETGGGGGGSSADASQAAQNGGASAAGVVIIYEYE